MGAGRHPCGALEYIYQKCHAYLLRFKSCSAKKGGDLKSRVPEIGNPVTSWHVTATPGDTMNCPRFFFSEKRLLKRVLNTVSISIVDP